MEEDKRMPTEKMVWEKEKEILNLLANGKKNKDIAAELNINDKAIQRVRERALANFTRMQYLLPEKVQEYLVSWALRHNKTISGEELSTNFKKQIDKHKEDLYQVTRELLRKLDSYILWDVHTLIGEIIVEEGNFEAISFFQDDVTIGLFEHLKHDIDELKPYNMWGEIPLKNFSPNLKKQISSKAAERDFNNRCSLCKDWA